MAQIRRQKHAVIGIMLVILLVCELASLAVLFSRMRMFSAEVDFGDIIPLTLSDTRTKVTIQKYAAAAPDASVLVPVQNDGAAFTAYDADTVWSAETEVEIFRLSHDNENGDMTIKSSNGDKLIAPGTSNEYVFTLKNTGNIPLDYTLTMEAWVEGTELHLPVKARVWDYTDTYLLGSPTQSEDVLALNTFNGEGVLGAGRLAVYTLEWEWPFEQGNDAFDTLLGDLVVDNDLTLTIRINTMAMYDANPDDPKVSESGLSSPKTGDQVPISMLAIVVSTALVIAVIAFLAGHKQKDEANGQTEE